MISTTAGIAWADLGGAEGACVVLLEEARMDGTDCVNHFGQNHWSC